MTGRIHSIETFGAVDGPGIRFVAFMQGCPLRCQFCHNPDTWNPQAPVQFEWTPEELLYEVRKYRSFIRKGGVTLSGGEPLMQAPFVKEFFTLCQSEGIHTALDTSGAIFTPTAIELMDCTDLFLLDIKTLDDAMHPWYIGSPRTNNQRWLDLLLENRKPVWIRHVLVPERTADDEHLIALAKYLQHYTPIIQRIELLPYHTLGVHKYEGLGIPYPLVGIPDLQPEALQHARQIFSTELPGIDVK